MWRKPRESPSELREIVLLLRDYAIYLMSINARLEEIAMLLGGDDDAGSDSDS